MNITDKNKIEAQDDDSFRDHIATVDQQGKRVWVYPKKPKGRFYNYRKYLSYVFLLLLFGLPLIEYKGQPFVLFNILESKFIIFGIYFGPQDFHLFVIAMLIAVVFIALFTVIYGRLFCGWVCPQTIFMELVYRRIEYWIEGDARAQKKLDQSNWTSQKYFKKTLKHIIFFSIAVLIAHTFLMWIIGKDALWQLITDPVNNHWGGFIAMIIFSLAFYGVFAFLREQVCTVICPYGRLQGVLLDENSLAVAYDFERGEPRGKLKKQKESIDLPIVQGDCIDCNLCVQVCPTGIDIRHGTQLECVNCTACMDACDEVMTKIDKPLGLIRIDSYNRITKKTNKIFTSRVAAYSLVLLILIGLESFLFVSRSQIETLFLRTPGLLYQDNEDGYISNLYNYQLINKTDKALNIEFKSQNSDDIKFQLVGQAPKTIPMKVSEGAVFIKVPIDQLTGRKTKIIIDVYGDGELIETIKTNFFGPVK